MNISRYITIFLTLIISTLFNFTYANELQEPLVICTTGDYPPLTYYNVHTDRYDGIDVYIAKRFAHHIGRKVKFYLATWPSLNTDLKEHCDMAVGGISNTENRAKLFNLSTGITKSQKAPIFSK